MLKIILCIGLMLTSPLALSLNPSTEQEFIDLGNSEQWIRQLYLVDKSDKKNNRRILDDDFYFSDTEHIDPVTELKASHLALFQNFDNITDEHPLCRFPARFLFIDKKLELNTGIDPFVSCPALKKWSTLDAFSKITIVKVDGYFGNPASTFGHLVLRVGNEKHSTTLLDTSINYGAMVPPNENMAVYIFRGITGGYTATISLEDFYHQDLVYTKNEFRDMWNYELNLTDEQKRILLGHVWELLERRSTYYFIKYNCAFALAEIMEVVTGYEFVSERSLYYPPIRLFQEVDKYEAHHPGQLVASRTYVPSQDKMLSNILTSLNKEEASAVKTYITSKHPDIEKQIQPFFEDRQSFILEVLLEYYDYLIKGYPETGEESANRRIEIIKARLRRPVGKELTFDTVEPPNRPPGQTTRTTKFGFGIQYNDNYQGVFSVTPFSLAPLDLGNSVLSEMTVLKTEIAVQDSIEFSGFTLANVAQRSDLNRSSLAAHPLSWTVNTGINCISHCDPSEGLQLKTGVGQSLSFGPTLNSILVNAFVEGKEAGFSGELELALPEVNRVSGIFRSEYFYPVTDADKAGVRFSGKTRYSFNPEHSIELTVSRKHATNGVSLMWLWSPY